MEAPGDYGEEGFIWQAYHELPRFDGNYTVTTVERIGITRNLRPQRVHVRAGHDDRLDFLIDTGIR